MARVDPSGSADNRRDPYEGLPSVGSPEFEQMARDYWALPHGSPDRERYEPIPIEFYRWL